MGLAGGSASEDPQRKGPRLGSFVIQGPSNGHNQEMTLVMA